MDDEPVQRPHRWRRVLLRVGAAFVVLAVVVAVAGVWAVRRSFPGYAGVLRLPGLLAPVTVYRDGYAVPQVYASSADDLFRAQGYVHAQERFWEMDFRRHVTAGRLASGRPGGRLICGRPGRWLVAGRLGRRLVTGGPWGWLVLVRLVLL